MTDREPDDLYDALRDRLADYGQEPPAPLWAGIRAQLPPPVAQPKLRRRRLGLLALLLLIVSVGSWQWWQLEHKSSPLGTETTVATAPIPTNKAAALTQTNSTEKPQNIANSADYATAHTTETGVPSSLASTSADVASEVAGTSGTAPKSTAAATPATSATSAAALVAAAGRARPNPAMGRTANTLGAGTGRQSNGSAAASRKATPVAVAPDAAIGHSLATARNQNQANTRHKSAQAASRPQSTQADQHGKAVLLAANNAKRNLKRHSSESKRARANTAETLAATGNAPATISTDTVLQSADEAENTRTKQPKRSAHAVTATRTQAQSVRPVQGPDASAAVVSQSPSADGPTAAAPVSFVAWSLLQPRAVALALQPWATPTLQLNADTLPHLPGPIVRRWAVQLLAGPALTYRQLSTSGADYSAAPIAIPNPTTNYATATSSIAGLERAALGGGAQVMVQRTLTKNWTLSAGLGYTQYATRLAVQQVTLNTTTSFRPDSGAVTTSIHRRDIYHFATVPLRVGYGWTLTGRWRVGLLAGADAAFYMGGNSTEGSACACQTQNWGITGSPYRPFSLGVSLGAEVYYRLTDRWALVARPTASYLLTPLGGSAAAYGERHLFGGTALLGVSYDLP